MDSAVSLERIHSASAAAVVAVVAVVAAVVVVVAAAAAAVVVGVVECFVALDENAVVLEIAGYDGAEHVCHYHYHSTSHGHGQNFHHRTVKSFE
jgi:hypothetical protein